MRKNVPVEILCNINEQQFTDSIYGQRKPVILRGLDIGACRMRWSAQYLAHQLGQRDVSVHVTENPKMNFIEKNFAYRTLPFNVLLERAAEVEHQEFFFSQSESYYLRSLGSDPRRDVSDIRQQFPNIAPDISFPQFYPEERFFSSVFRVSSAALTLWTHYDIMDNLLIQVIGRKRAILFHPDDLLHLYMKGDKSQVLDLENPDLERFPDFAKATPFVCNMEPGDVLFIPALWFHNMTALDFSVAVNVFWKHLGDEFYDRKDPYGNKDLVDGAQALMLADKSVKALERLPTEYKTFYARKIIDRMNKFL